jgi:putative peptide zinc metalloprotease protein
MKDSLFSPLWHRLAERRVYLRPQVQVRHQQFRDQSWHLLMSSTNGRQYRINEFGYRFIGRCDGTRTVQEVWDSLLDSLGDAAPTQDEVIRLLAELDREELLLYDIAPDLPEMFRRKANRDQRRLQGFVNPLAFRIPIGNPSALLARLDRLAGLVFRPAVFWVWTIAVVCFGLVGAMHWPELRQHISNGLASPRHLFLAWLVFPCVKLMHELAHALAVRRWGGEVHEMGLTFFVMMPAPYVDASAASALRSRSARVIVSAAGMMVELAVATIALACWLTVQPGTVRDIALATMFVCSVSTLVFNANPLLRFDGYYILSDALDLPNLASRSRAWWLERLERLMEGTARARQVVPARGERKWLEMYAPMAALNGIVIAGVIVLWLGSVSTVLGIAAGLYAIISVGLRPLWGLVKRMLLDGARGHSRWRSGAILAVTGALICMLLFVLPMPFHTTAQGVVWVPEQAQVRPQTEGFIRGLPVRDGEQVEAGQILVVLDDPTLPPAREILLSRLTGLQTERFTALLSDPARVQNILKDLEQTAGELARTDERIALLQVRSEVAGTLVMPRQQDLQGGFARKGQVLGYVLDDQAPRVRAAVPEGDAVLVRERTRSVEARLAEAVGQAWHGTVVMDTPAATRELPSAALGDRGGGELATDPAEQHGLRTVEPVVLIDLRLPEVILRHIGERVWVRFDHGAMPLAEQSWRRLKLLFLRHFNPTD